MEKNGEYNSEHQNESEIKFFLKCYHLLCDNTDIKSKLLDCKDLAKKLDSLAIECCSVIVSPYNQNQKYIIYALDINHVPEPNINTCNKGNLKIFDTFKGSWPTKLFQENDTNKNIKLLPGSYKIITYFTSEKDIVISISLSQSQIISQIGYQYSYEQIGHIARITLQKDSDMNGITRFADTLIKQNSHIKMVVIKDASIETVFRTLPLKVIAGSGPMIVDAKENGLSLKFDYSKVYWSSRLSGERLLMAGLIHEYAKIKPTAVWDCCAGIGALPSLILTFKSVISICTNDLNPDCYTSILNNMKKNIFSKTPIEQAKLISQKLFNTLINKQSESEPKKRSREIETITSNNLINKTKDSTTNAVEVNLDIKINDFPSLKELDQSKFTSCNLSDIKNNNSLNKINPYTCSVYVSNESGDDFLYRQTLSIPDEIESVIVYMNLPASGSVLSTGLKFFPRYKNLYLIYYEFQQELTKQQDWNSMGQPEGFIVDHVREVRRVAPNKIMAAVHCSASWNSCNIIIS